MKPIAYIDHVSGKPKLIDAYVIQTPIDIPLYTHPVELTDEEILHQNLIWGQQNGEDYSMLTVEDIEPLISLIRAILRKASERWTKNEYEPPDFFFMENDLMGKR